MTLLLVIITVVISLVAWQRESLLRQLAMNGYAVGQQGQYWRLLTSGFVHADWSHLFFNMLSLYFMGPPLEHALGQLFGPAGSWYFLGLYLLAVILSDVPSLLRHKNNPHYSSLGASGGVSAVVFAGILFFPLNKICLYFAICIPGFLFGVLYLAYSWYESRRAGSYINHSAHLWGALVGVVGTVLLHPPVVSHFFSEISRGNFF